MKMCFNPHLTTTLSSLAVEMRNYNWESSIFEIINFDNDKYNSYLIKTIFLGTVVNRKLPFLHGDALKITLKVQIKWPYQYLEWPSIHQLMSIEHAISNSQQTCFYPVNDVEKLNWQSIINSRNVYCRYFSYYTI